MSRVRAKHRLRTRGQASGSGLKLSTRSRPSVKHTHAPETSAVMSSHATHRHTHTHTIISPGPVLPYDYPASPSQLSLSAPPSSQTRVQWVAWCQVSVVTGPDNQRVCKCVIYQSLFMVRVLKGRYFYGNCRWSILLYIYVINMWLNLHLTGSFWLSVLQLLLRHVLEGFH